MAIPVIATSGAAVSGTGSSFNIPYPSGIEAGDLLLIAYSQSASTNQGSPSGWAVVGESGTTDPHTYVWSKTAVGDESGTLNYTPGGTAAKVMRMHRITGGTNIEGAATNTGSSKTPGHPDVTTTAADRLVLVVGGVNDDETASSFTGETGGDLTLHSQDSTAAGTDQLLYLQEADMASSGTISGGTWSYSGATEDWSHVGFAVYGDAGTTTYKTLAVVASGTPTFAKKSIWARTLAVVATGAPVKAIKVALTKAVVATGAATVLKKVTLVTKAVVATGIVTFNASRITLKSFAVVATGTPAILKKVVLGAKAVVATGTPAILKKVVLGAKAVVATGTPLLAAAKTFARTLAVIAVGVVDFSLVVKKTFTVVATGTPTLSEVVTFLRTKAVVAVGVPAKAVKVSLTKAVVAVGTPVLSTINIWARTFAVVATGIVTFVGVQVIGRLFAVVATGTPTFAKTPTFVKVLSVTATGASAITKKVALGAKAVVATAIPVFLRNIGLTKAVVAVGTPSESHSSVVGKLIAVVATGTASLSKVLTALVQPAVVATGAAALSAVTTFTKALSAVATGIAGLATNFIPGGPDTITKLIEVVAVGVPTVVRKMFYTGAVTATGIVTFAGVMKFIESFAVVATGTATSVQHFLQGQAGGRAGVRHLIHVIWSRMYHRLSHLLTHRDGAGFFLDNFIDINGTGIEDHIPDVDTSLSGWTEQQGTADVVDYDLRAQTLGPLPGSLFIADIGAIDMDISARITLGGGGGAGLVFRYAGSGAGTGFMVVIVNSATVGLFEWDGATLNTVSNIAHSEGDYVNKVLRVRAAGTSIKTWFDGTAYQDLVNADHLTQTGFGVRSNSLGQAFHNIIATQIGD
jgi:hypothetical protein